MRPISIVIGDATRDELDPDTAYLRALELFCARAGDQRAHAVGARRRPGSATRSPSTGPTSSSSPATHLDDDTIARWAYAIRLAAGAIPIATYRRGGPRVRMRTTGTQVLPAGAAEAQRRIVEMVESERHPLLEPSRHSGGAPALRLG